MKSQSTQAVAGSKGLSTKAWFCWMHEPSLALRWLLGNTHCWPLDYLLRPSLSCLISTSHGAPSVRGFAFQVTGRVVLLKGLL